MKPPEMYALKGEFYGMWTLSQLTKKDNIFSL